MVRRGPDGFERGPAPLKNGLKGFKGVKGVIVLEVFDAMVFNVFYLGRVILYTVFMVFPLPKALVKTLAKNLLKILTKNSSDKLTENCLKNKS